MSLTDDKDSFGLAFSENIKEDQLLALRYNQEELVDEEMTLFYGFTPTTNDYANALVNVAETILNDLSKAARFFVELKVIRNKRSFFIRNGVFNLEYFKLLKSVLQPKNRFEIDKKLEENEFLEHNTEVQAIAIYSSQMLDEMNKGGSELDYSYDLGILRFIKENYVLVESDIDENKAVKICALKNLYEVFVKRKITLLSQFELVGRYGNFYFSRMLQKLRGDIIKDITGKK